MTIVYSDRLTTQFVRFEMVPDAVEPLGYLEDGSARAVVGA